MHLAADSPISYDGSQISYSNLNGLSATLNSASQMSLHQPSRTSAPMKYAHTQTPQYSQAPSHTSVATNCSHPQQFTSHAPQYSSQAAQYAPQHQQYIPPTIQYYNPAQTHHLGQPLGRHDSVQPSHNNPTTPIHYLPYNSADHGSTHTAVGASTGINHSPVSEHQYSPHNEYDDEYIRTWAIQADVPAARPVKRRQTAPAGSIAGYSDVIHMGSSMDGYGFGQPLQYGLHMQSPMATHDRVVS